MFDSYAWHSIKGFDDYEISEKGEVRTWKNGKHGRLKEPRLRKIHQYKNGYQYVGLTRNNWTRNFKIHRLVLEAFRGPCPKGMEACHRDGDPSNNNLSNLRWDTHINNMMDAISSGRMICGERHHSSKLTEYQVRLIRKFKNNSKNRRFLSNMYGVSERSIGNVMGRRTWKHIKETKDD
jgi:hypothetical protein